MNILEKALNDVLRGKKPTHKSDNAKKQLSFELKNTIDNIDFVTLTKEQVIKIALKVIDKVYV